MAPHKFSALKFSFYMHLGNAKSVIFFCYCWCQEEDHWFYVSCNCLCQELDHPSIASLLLSASKIDHWFISLLLLCLCQKIDHCQFVFFAIVIVSVNE